MTIAPYGGIKDPNTNKTVAPEYITDGVAKAWANLNGTGTIALRDSLNIGSVTDRGTGQYSLNFTSVMGDANYSANTGGSFQGGTGNNIISRDNGLASTAASYSPKTSASSSNSVADIDYLDCVIFGDLA